MDIALKNWILFVSALAVCRIFLAIGIEASADTYLGCYDEYGSVQIFIYNTGIALSNLTTSNLATDGCRKYCRKTLTYSYAGLWGGTYCYCAQEVVNKDGIAKVNDSLCHLSCPGEPTEFCGGSNTSYLYSVYSVCSRGLYGRNCNNSCNCKDSKSCTVSGLCPGNECAAGWILNTIWKREKCSIDIDECYRNTSGCSQNCKNNQGSYECECNIGFELGSDNHTCEDVDECDVDNGGCQHYCSNTVGSFVCSCRPGYLIAARIGETYNCVDIDECAEETAGCEHNCTNTIGGYNCSCRYGFQLNSDLKTCSDVDECTDDIHSCTHICNNKYGSYSCSCPGGYNLDGEYTCNKDFLSTILVLGISNGIQAFIFIILITAVIVLLILLKRERNKTAKAKEQAVDLDVYTALDRKTQSVNAEESVYTSIIPPDQTHDNVYASAKTN